MAKPKTALVLLNVTHSQLIAGKWQLFLPRDTPYRVPADVAEDWVERQIARPAG